MRFPSFSMALLALLSLMALGPLVLAQDVSQPTAAPATRPGPKLWEATGEDYAIFAVVIQHHFKNSQRGVPPHVLIATRTEDWRILDDEELAALDDDGFLFEESPLRLPARARWHPDDLQEVLFDANRQPAQLVTDSFRIVGTKVVLIDAGSRYEPPRPNGQMWRDYPQSEGTFLLSRPGYSRKASRAIINVNSHPFGANAGYGMMYLLEKANGTWKVIDSKGSWIS